MPKISELIALACSLQQAINKLQLNDQQAHDFNRCLRSVILQLTRIPLDN
jgi:hypothetical protein